MKDEVEALIKAEVERANKKWQLYHSKHEAYGVLVEEWEEAEEIMSHIKQSMVFLRRDLRWDATPLDGFDVNADWVRRHPINAICELIHVAAVCDRWEASKKVTHE